MALTIAKTNQELAAWQPSGRVALVPTMGALHAGHMALVAEAKRRADQVMVYIFVNPAQFGPTEDFSHYPRTWEADVEKCRAAGADAIYAPTVEDVYPPGFSTSISVKGPSEGLESDFRPGHFDGVATVLTTMFIRIAPHIAVFGEKDYQQLMVVKKLVKDLAMPIEIIGVPTLREGDGLAMSSRNAYLSTHERVIAAQLYATLNETAAALRQQIPPAQALAAAQQKILAAGFAKVDYIALADAETLRPLAQLNRPARLLVAAWLGTTRLIDNLPVEPL